MFLQNLEDQVKSAERSSAALEVVQIIMGGTLGFEVLDRWDDTSPFSDVADWGDVWNGQLGPMMWFILSVLIFCMLGAGITWFSRGLAEQAESVLMLKFKLNRKIFPAKMYRYLMKKPLAAESYDQFKQDMRKVTWSEGDNPIRWTKGLPYSSFCCACMSFCLLLSAPKNRCHHALLSCAFRCGQRRGHYCPRPGYAIRPQMGLLDTSLHDGPERGRHADGRRIHQGLFGRSGRGGSTRPGRTQRHLRSSGIRSRF